MSKFGGFFSRKAGLYDKSTDIAAAASATSNDNPLELDEELFSALGAQLGSENESLRNLLLDANSKIGELDTIKNAVGKLVDPVSKALRAFEAEKSEKISLQTVLNNTRTAYGKLRNEVAELEKKASRSEKECQALRQELTTTQHLLPRWKPPKLKSPSISPPGARKSPISKLVSRRTPAKARRCARKTGGSTSGFPSPTSASSRWNRNSMARASGC